MAKEKAPEVKERSDYICMVPCWHMGHRFHKGDRASFAEDQVPRNKKHKMVHFVPLDPVAPQPAPEPGPVIVNEKERPEK